MNVDLLLSAGKQEKRYKPASKYQETAFDVSLLLPLKLTTAEIETKLQRLNPLIDAVRLVDFFEKPEWNDVRSLAFRITLQSGDHTLTKEEIENVRQLVITTFEKMGGQLRS